MKKIIIFVVCCLMGILNVSAEEYDTNVRYEFIDNIYSNRQIGEDFYTGKQGIIYANELLAYCLDPHLILNSETYTTSSDFSILNIDNNQLNYLELVNYFGYGYSGRIDPKYYLATQEIMWEYLVESEIYWTDGKDGEVINIDSYKNEILTDVINYQRIPDIPEYIETYQNHELIFEDENFKYYEPNMYTGTIEGNKLILSTQYKGIHNLTLIRKPITTKASYIYLSEGSQRLATFGYSSNISDTIDISYKVKTLSKITIIKKDKNTKEIIQNNPLKIKIYDITKDCYLKENDSEIITIGETGIYESSFYLEEGKYQIEEIEAPVGYEKITKPVTFNIYEYNGPNKDIILYNSPKKYSIKIYKKGEIFTGFKETKNGAEGIYIEASMNDVVYGLYASEDFYDFINDKSYKKDDLIAEININNGYGSITGLSYGHYYLKEIKYDQAYEPTEIIKVQFENDRTSVIYEFVNKLKKGNLIIKKVDNEIPLTGAHINISKENQYNINLISNYDGYIKINNIPYGIYYLQENQAPEGYQLDLEQKIIELNTETIEYKFINEKIKDEPPVEPEEPKEEDQPVEPDEPKEEDPPVEPEEPKEEDPSVEPDEPNEKDPPVEPDEPKEEDPPVEPDEPKEEDSPVEPEEPKEEDPPVEPDEPKEEDPPVEPDEPKEEDPPVEPEEPKEEDPPVEPEEPKEEDPPVEPEEPKEEDPSVEPDEPNEKDPPVEPDEPKEEDPPVEPEEPKEEDPSVEPDEPNEKDPPVEPDEPKEEDPPVEPDEPKEEDSPVEPEEPKEEDPPVEPDEPKEEDPPVEPDEPKEEDPPVEPEEPKEEEILEEIPQITNPNTSVSRNHSGLNIIILLTFIYKFINLHS